MKRDREVYPNRPLGAYLWCLDLLHQARFEAEQNGGKISLQGIGWCNEALELFRQYVGKGDAWLAMEMLPYATDATRILTGGTGISFKLGFDARGGEVVAGQWSLGRESVAEGMLPVPADVEALMGCLGKAKLAPFKESYL